MCWIIRRSLVFYLRVVVRNEYAYRTENCDLDFVRTLRNLLVFSMIHLTDLQRAALDQITDRGATTPITGKEIANKIGLKPRDTGKEGADLRSIIHALRVKGYPICGGTKGYWWPKTKEEVQESIESMEGRAREILEAVEGLRLGLGMIGATVGQIRATSAKPVAYRVNGKVGLIAADKIEEFEAAYPEAVRL